MARIEWKGPGGVLDQAAAIVRSYDTGVTLRQLFYRLVAAETLPNTISGYKSLSRFTAEARRQGGFPPLVDNTREVVRAASFDGPDDALEYMVDTYRRDRSAGQAFNVFIGVEKRALVGLLQDWFLHFGVGVVALGGYASQTLADNVVAEIDRDGRPAMLLYGGDFDPSGVDIDRDFIERTRGRFVHARRVALNWDQVAAFDLPPQMGKATDSRAGRFVAEHGSLVQVELDALPPDTLRDIYSSALNDAWDLSTFEAIIDQENQDRAVLETVAQGLP